MCNCANLSQIGLIEKTWYLTFFDFFLLLLIHQKFKLITSHVWGPLGAGPGGHGGTRDGVPEMLFEPFEQTW